MTTAGTARTFPLRVVLVASVVTATANLPVFLFGALASTMRAEIGYSAAGTGLAVSCFFAASGLTAPLMARLVDRAGPLTAVRIGGCGTAAAMALIALRGEALGIIVALLIVAGAMNAVGQTTSNMLIAALSTPGHDGLSFGIKQGSVPLATFLAGMALPTFAVGGGWRWAFVIAAALTAAVAAVAPRFAAHARADDSASGDRIRARGRSSDRPILALITLSAFLGSGVPLALAAYFVDFAITSGWSTGAAGFLLGATSLFAVAGRVGAGWWMDVRGRRGARPIPLLLAAAMVTAGGAGCVLLTWGQSSATALAVGMSLGLGMGWGWAGLMHLTIVGLNRSATATSTGFVLVGVFGGGVVMPSVLGLIIQHQSYSMGWAACAAGFVIAAMALTLAHVLLRRRGTSD